MYFCFLVKRKSLSGCELLATRLINPLATSSLTVCFWVRKGHAYKKTPQTAVCFNLSRMWDQQWAEMRSTQPWTWQQNSCVHGPAWAKRSSRSWWRMRKAPCSARPSTTPAWWFTCWFPWTRARTSCSATPLSPTGRAAVTASSPTGQQSNIIRLLQIELDGSPNECCFMSFTCFYYPQRSNQVVLERTLACSWFVR